MKLTEILIENEDGTAEVYQWLRRMGIKYADVFLNDKTGVMNINIDEGGVDLGFKGISELPYKFHYVHEHFALTPNPKIETIKNLPNFCTSLDLGSTGITSLVGIAEEITGGVNSLHLQNMDILEGGLGILQLKNLHTLEIARGDKHYDAFKIIQKYVRRPNDIFECQAELIENGFEEYAKL